MASLTSTVTMALVDNVTKPARTVAQALKDAERAAEQVGKGLQGSGATDRLATSLAKLKANAKDVGQVAAAMRDFAKAEGLAADKSQWTKTQSAAVRQWETQTISALRAVKREEVAFNRSLSRPGAPGGFGSNIAAGMSSVGAGELARLREARRLSAGMSGAGLAAAVAALPPESASVSAMMAALSGNALAQSRLTRGMSAAGGAAQAEKAAAAEALKQKEAAAAAGGTSLIPLGGGLLPMAGAYGAYEGASHLIHAGIERQHVRVGAQNAGIGTDELKRAEAAAIAAAKGAPNLSATQILELYKEGRSAVQDPREMLHLIPELAKAASVLKGSGVENANIADLVKGGESLGLMNDPKRFHAFVEGQVKAMQVMGKTISTEQIYEAAKYSKSAGATLTDDFLNTTLPSLIQEMHGSSAGDAMAMLVKTLRGGIQNKHIPVQKLNELGLLEDPSKIKKNKAGQIMGYGGKVVGDETLASDPRKWFQEIFKPAAEKAGYVTLSDQVRLLNQTLPGTAANLGRVFLQQEKALEQHRRNYQAAPGLDESVANQTRDAKAASMELKAAFDDLGAAVAASPAIGSGLHGVAEAVRSLAGVVAGSESLNPLQAAEDKAKKIAEEQGRKATVGDIAKQFFGGLFGGGASDDPRPWMKGWQERRDANKKFFADPSVINAAPSFAASSIGIGGFPWAPAMGVHGGIAPNPGIPAFLQMQAWSPTLDIVGLKSKALEGENLGDEMKERLSFTAMPMVDTSHFEQAKQDAVETKTAIDGLNVTVTPMVDASSINAARADVAALLGDIKKAEHGALSFGAKLKADSARLSGLFGKVSRGNFTTAGVQGD